MALTDNQIKFNTLGALEHARLLVEADETPYELTLADEVATTIYRATPERGPTSQYPYVLVFVALAEQKEQIDAIVDRLKAEES